MANGDKTALVESHETLEELREAMRRFHGVAQESAASLRNRAVQSSLEIEQIVQAQQQYVDSLESDAANSDEEEEDGGGAAELDTARDRLADLQAAQTEVESIIAEIGSELSQFGTGLDNVIPRATDFLHVKLDVLNEKAAVRLDIASTSERSIGKTNSLQSTSSSVSVEPIALNSADFVQNVPLPDGYQWIYLSDIDLTNELAGVKSPTDFKKVDYSTMRNGLETFRNKVLPILNTNRGKSVWDLESIFRSQDAISGTSYEHGVYRAFEAFFSQNDAIYLNRGRRENHFRIINGRHRIKAALDAGWTAIPARTKDLR